MRCHVTSTWKLDVGVPKSEVTWAPQRDPVFKIKNLPLFIALPMEEQLRKLQEERTCKVCMDREVSIVFIPCGHLVVCKDCAPSLRKCPICRGAIKGTVRTFLSWPGLMLRPQPVGGGGRRTQVQCHPRHIGTLSQPGLHETPPQNKSVNTRENENKGKKNVWTPEWMVNYIII